MIDPVSAVGSKEVYEASAYNAESFEGLQVSQANQDEFRVLLDSNGIKVAQAESTAVFPTTVNDGGWVVQPGGPAEMAPKVSMGEILTNEIQAIRQNWFDARADMDAAFNGDGLTIETAMRLQMDMQHSAVMVQMLVSQVAALNQEISKLMKAS